MEALFEDARKRELESRPDTDASADWWDDVAEVGRGDSETAGARAPAPAT